MFWRWQIVAVAVRYCGFFLLGRERYGTSVSYGALKLLTCWPNSLLPDTSFVKVCQLNERIRYTMAALNSAQLFAEYE